MSRTLLIPLAVVIMLAGCRTSQRGVTNTFGTVTAAVQATPEEATAAAQRTLEDMDLIIITSSATGLDGRVEAKTAHGENVQVDIERIARDLSEVSIRVGAFGEEALSLTILDGMRRRLAGSR